MSGFDQEFCIEPDCNRPTEGYGDRCETHTKQFQRSGRCWPIADKLTPRGRFLEACIRLAEADGDDEFDVAFRTAWNIPTREALKKIPAREIRKLAAQLRSSQARRALKEARARGVRPGPKPSIDSAKVRRMLRRGDSPAKVAKLLGVHLSSIYRLSSSSTNARK